MKKSSNIKQMKLKIAEYLQIDEKDFLIKKNSHYGNELKASGETLDKLDVNLINIYVEFGLPLNEGNISM